MSDQSRLADRYLPWWDHANCVGLDPELFHPEKGNSGKNARQVCSGCTVVDECLEHALGDASLLGIRGGTSWRERQKIRKRQRDEAKETEAS